MGTYGPVVPGTLMEELAHRALSDLQNEKISHAVFVASASSTGVSSENIREAQKEYIKFASPRANRDQQKKDAATRKLVETQAKAGPITITPAAKPRNQGLRKRKIPTKKRNA